MPVRGDFRALRLLAEKLQTLVSKASKEALRQELSDATMREVNASFHQQQAPTGERWSETKARKRPILRRSGRLASSFLVQRWNWGFVVRSNVSYARFHQQGTGRMLKRSMLPERTVLPLRWRSSFAALTKRWIQKGLER